MKLFPFQADTVKKVRDGFEKHPVQCLSFYTGSGKTNIASEVMRLEVKDNPRIKIGVSAYLTTEIRDQFRERVNVFGLDDVTCVIGSDEFSFDKNVFIFNPQALFRNEELKGLKFDLLIVDEAHAGMNLESKMINLIVDEHLKRGGRILLVSATPWDLLSQPRFKDVPVYVRSLFEGIKDGLITDFKFITEEAQIEFRPTDFDKEGNLKQPRRKAPDHSSLKLSTVKSACYGKFENLLERYDVEMGKKVIVICPPGNNCEIARDMSKHFGGLHYTELATDESGEDNLTKFKKDKSLRFLFVVQKCSVGFDMKDLTSIVDLTMTRNIKLLTQRIGRIARKNKDVKKSYFYVYDKSLLGHQLDWLVFTIIDVSLGHFKDLTTKDMRYVKIKVKDEPVTTPDEDDDSSDPVKRPKRARLFSKIVAQLADADAIENVHTLKFDNREKPTKWTLAKAVEAAKEFETRLLLWETRPSLYKWFIQNDKQALDRLFPPMRVRKYWDEQKVIESMRGQESREAWKRSYPSAHEWVTSHGRQDLRDAYLPPSKTALRWDDETIEKTVMEMSRWSDLNKFGSLKRKLIKDRTLATWKERWHTAKGKKPLRGKGHRA